MQDLVIVCENSFGLDVQFIVEAINSSKTRNGKDPIYNIKGFICPEAAFESCGIKLTSILGSIENWQTKEDVYAMGIVDPRHKEKAAQILKSKGAKFVSLWAPWVLANPMPHGEGCIIAAHSIKDNAIIHDFVTLFYSMISTAEIGSYSSVMAYSNVTNAKLAEYCYLEDNTAIMYNLSVVMDTHVLPNSIIINNVKKPGTLFGIPARKSKGE